MSSKSTFEVASADLPRASVSDPAFGEEVASNASMGGRMVVKAADGSVLGVIVPEYDLLRLQEMDAAARGRMVIPGVNGDAPGLEGR